MTCDRCHVEDSENDGFLAPRIIEWKQFIQKGTDGLARRGVIAERGPPLHESSTRVLHHRSVSCQKEFPLGAEVVLDQPHRDPGFGSDGLEGNGFEAAFDDDATYGAGDLPPPHLMVNQSWHETLYLSRAPNISDLDGTSIS